MCGTLEKTNRQTDTDDAELAAAYQNHMDVAEAREENEKLSTHDVLSFICTFSFSTVDDSPPQKKDDNKNFENKQKKDVTREKQRFT